MSVLELLPPPTCEFCGALVKPTGKPDGLLWMRCCSDACQDALDVRIALVTRTCPICGGVNSYALAKFCSTACARVEDSRVDQ